MCKLADKKRTNTTTLPIETQVLITTNYGGPTGPSKLAERYRGPYKKIEIITPVT
jgi:hypothetical protein